jgi:MFS family permease
LSHRPTQYNLRYALIISVVSALGGLLFGYDWVVIGGAKPFFEACFQLTSAALIGWANSCALLGCLAGSIVSGPLSDRFGRKRGLIVSALLFGISSILTGWAPVFTWFIIWRMTGGIAIGLASAISPLYISEVSPAPWRGRLVALHQLTIVVGILAAQIVNWLIARPIPAGASAEMMRLSWNGQYGWRWMFTAVHVLLGFAYRLNLKGLPVLLLTLCAIACYALTLAPVVWILIAEIFPNRIRAAAMSVAVSALWAACFALTFTFPILNRTPGSSGTFWLYAGICFAGLVFVRMRVRETMGKSLEAIELEVTA